MRLAMAPVLLFVGLLGAPASAQTCYEENGGSNFEDGSSTGTASFAVRFVAPSALSVSRAEVFTGETAATHGVAIWSDDAALDQPLVPLGSGSFVVNPVNGWQGADLTPPVGFVAGQVYWFVWSTTAGSQTSIDLPMAFPGQEFRVSLDGGATWTPKIQSTERHFKFRFFCGCSPAGLEYGAGCPGTGGVTPHLSLSDCPVAGGNVTVTLDNGLPNASALIFLGLAQASIPINFTGCNLLVAPLLPVVISVPLSGTGSVSLPGPIPAGTAGVSIELQAFVMDPGGAPPGFSNSNGVDLAIQ